VDGETGRGCQTVQRRKEKAVPAADHLLHHRIHGLRPQTPRLPPQRKRRKQHQLSTRRRWTAVALLHGLGRDDTRSPSLTNVSLAGLLVESQARHSSDEYRAPSSPKIPTGRLVVVRQHCAGGNVRSEVNCGRRARVPRLLIHGPHIHSLVLPGARNPLRFPAWRSCSSPRTPTFPRPGTEFSPTTNRCACARRSMWRR
jgi:hypothetical protein